MNKKENNNKIIILTYLLHPTPGPSHPGPPPRPQGPLSVPSASHSRLRRRSRSDFPTHSLKRSVRWCRWSGRRSRHCARSPPSCRCFVAKLSSSVWILLLLVIADSWSKIEWANEWNHGRYKHTATYTCVYLRIPPGWWRGTVVERRSLAGELSLSCARPAADGWPLMWVSHPL